MLFFVCSLSFVAYTTLPEKKDAIFASRTGQVKIETSGSIGIYKYGKCQKTYGNETLVDDEYTEWCSNVAKVKNDPNYNPWIQYSLSGKQMKIKGFAVRNGCCRYACCCEEENGKIHDYECCCFLYSYSLLASNDNKTWTLIHKVEQDRSFEFCKIKTFELKQESAPFTYFRLVLDQEYPNCPKCMQINQVELYGQVITTSFDNFVDGQDEEESISIIGRVKKDQ